MKVASGRQLVGSLPLGRALQIAVMVEFPVLRERKIKCMQSLQIAIPRLHAFVGGKYAHEVMVSRKYLSFITRFSSARMSSYVSLLEN